MEFFCLSNEHAYHEDDICYWPNFMGKQSPGVESLLNYLSSSEISLQAHPVKSVQTYIKPQIKSWESGSREAFFCLPASVAELTIHGTTYLARNTNCCPASITRNNNCLDHKSIIQREQNLQHPASYESMRTFPKPHCDITFVQSVTHPHHPGITKVRILITIFTYKYRSIHLPSSIWSRTNILKR